MVPIVAGMMSGTSLDGTGMGGPAYLAINKKWHATAG